MPTLFSRDPFIRHLILIIILGLTSPVLLAQTTTPPTPPATIDPAAQSAEANPADPAAATNPAAASSASSSISSASSSSVKPPEKPIYKSTTERDNVLLAKAQPDETLWLETPNEKIIALFKTGETRVTKGALLILHASEIPQLWPAPLESLRRNLPIYGWETMAVPLPQKYATKAPEREFPSSSSASSMSSANSASSSDSASASSSGEITEAAASASSSEASSSSVVSSQPSSSSSSEEAKPVLPREQLIAERVDAAIKELNKVGQFNVVVLVDNSSAVESLAALYSKINEGTSNANTIDGPLQALIIVNLQDQEPLSKEQLSAVFSSKFVPIMDVFFGTDDQRQIDVRRQHHAEAMRQDVKIYQQFVLRPEHMMTVNDKQGFWLEKARGFMETKAEGSEFKLKK